MRFKKDKKQYILKNKDTSVLTFDYEKITDQISSKEIITYKIKHVRILEPKLLPKEYSDSIDSKKLKNWIEKRKVPKNRENSEKILDFKSKELQSNNNFMNYIDISYGLSLNDSYWIIPADKDFCWKNYNLYQNKFSEIISLIAFGINLTKEPEDIQISPEYTTDGMLAKCWTVLNNKIVLIKKSSEHYKKEAFAEYYMSQIADIMGFDHIDYDIVNFQNNISSCCSLFTTENIGFIPMYRCMKQKDTLKEGIKLLEAIEKIYGKEKMEDLMLFDSLIYNTDRHLGNFGMLVNNDTGKFLRAAPIFDNGNSILSFLNKEIRIEHISTNYKSRFNIDFDILSNTFVQNRHKKNLEKLKTFKFKKHSIFNLEDIILEKAEEFIQKRATFIIEQLNSKF